MISKLINRIKSFFGSTEEKNEAENGTRLDPSILKKRVIEAAHERAMSWDDQVDLPNAYEVRISTADWNAYYGRNVKAVERRLEVAVEQFAEAMGASLETPSVAIVVDDGVAPGDAFADAWFDDTAALATPSLGGVAKRAADRSNTEIPSCAAPGAVTPNRMGAHASDGAEEESPTTALVGPSGQLFRIHDGDTVGVMRDVDREAPSVELPYTDGMSHCSQVHAAFKRGALGWKATLLGRNGLCINGSDWTLAKDATVRLRDGDTIFFGDAGGDAFVFREG